mmetsp:Transcript_621/g.1277  ORF Transcript_621/g.1277 Transcript_621/m.1277 type:complete len:85 (+) Transcript_621:346-600(+)
MVQPMKGVLQDHIGTQGDREPLDCVKDSLYDVGALLKYVGPDKVEEMDEDILTPQPRNTKGQVLHCGTSRLTVDRITVHERILK